MKITLKVKKTLAGIEYNERYYLGNKKIDDSRFCKEVLYIFKF